MLNNLHLQKRISDAILKNNQQEPEMEASDDFLYDRQTNKSSHSIAELCSDLSDRL